MADRGDKTPARKTARTLPLTHRQHKATKRNQTEMGASTPAAAPLAASPNQISRGITTTTPRSRRDQSPTRSRRRALPKAAVAVPPVAPVAPVTPATPAARASRRGKPSRAQAAPAKPVRPLRPAKVTKPAKLTKPAKAAKAAKAAQPVRSARPKLRSKPVVAETPAEPTFAAALLAPEVAAAEMRPVLAPTEEPAERAAAVTAAAETPAAEAPVVEAPETPGDERALALELEAASQATSQTALGEPEEPAPARKMPTLAVMAALAQRAEPLRATYAPRDDVANVAVEVDTAPRLRTVRPTTPLTAPLGAAELDAAEVDAAEPAASAERQGAATTAPLDLFASVPTAQAGTAADLDARLDQPSATRAEPADLSALLARVAPVEPTERPGAGEDSAHRMWWPAALRRRAAPETRPIAAIPADQQARDRAPLDGVSETTAPRIAARVAARRAASNGAQRAEPRVSGQTPEAEVSAAPRRAGRADAQVVAQKPAQQPVLTGEQFSRRAQVTGARLRARAMRSPRVVVLSWTAGGHVAVACVAALIAVIAALRSSAGPNALATFNWALALALIAGLGAAAGYACAQTRRPQLATLALILSQLGALAWALALLGPRAALLLLAPASAALALRGAGRLGAIGAALGWLALFIAAVALNLGGQLMPALSLDGGAAALVDVALALVGLWLAVSILNSLYQSRLNVVARARAVEHAALHTEAQLDHLRTQTDDDAEALRRALRLALRGEQPERVYARGSLSVVAEEINTVVERLVDLGLDRVERKRLESATRRLTRVIERAWLGLPWSWPDATGTLLDDLLALLRMPPPADTPDLLDDTTPTGQVVAPHLFRNWQAPEPVPTDLSAQRTQPGVPGVPDAPSAPGYPSLPSMPSFPSYPSHPSHPSYSSLPSLWPSDPGLELLDPLELPPAPRWRQMDGADRAEPAAELAAERADMLADPADQQGAPDR